MNYLVLGLGVTGLSVAHCLHKEGHQVRVHDTRESPPGADRLIKEIPLTTGVLDQVVFSVEESVVISPGIPLATPAIQVAIEKGVHFLGDVDLFAERVAAPIIAITGSNAKSTVTTLTGAMASQCLPKVKIGGNLGVPMLDLIEEGTDLYVLELSSFQLETMHSLSPSASVILNISEDHMDRYDFRMEPYIAAKQRIHARSKAILVNRDDRFTFPNELSPSASFGLTEGQSDSEWGIRVIEDRHWLAKGSEPLIELEALPFKGLHNAANVLASLALCDLVGLEPKRCLQAVFEYETLPHRCQYLGKTGSIHWINDSKATNVGATLAAVNGLAPLYSSVALLLGGDGKGADFEMLAEAVALYPHVHPVLYGRDKPLIAGALKSKGVSYDEVDTLEQAVASALENGLSAAQGESLLLLSPACASFDQFPNFEKRGEAFIECYQQRKGADI